MTRWHTRAKYFYQSWLRLFQARFLGDASHWKCKGVRKSKDCEGCSGWNIACTAVNIWTPDLSANAVGALEELWSNLNERDAVQCRGPCAGENSGRGWLSLAAESWYAACRDLVKMRWMRVKGEWEGWRKEGGGGFSRFLAGVRYQEAAKALLMPHTSSPASYTMK